MKKIIIVLCFLFSSCNVLYYDYFRVNWSELQIKNKKKETVKIEITPGPFIIEIQKGKKKVIRLTPGEYTIKTPDEEKIVKMKRGITHKYKLKIDHPTDDILNDDDDDDGIYKKVE